MTALAIFLMALAIVGYGLISRRTQRTILTPPLLFTAYGFLLGDGGFHLIDLPVGSTLIHGLAELTLIIVLFTDASRISLRRLDREHNLPMRLLLVGMPLTIVLGTLAAMAVFPTWNLVAALLLAICLAPTDAALGQSVVSSPDVPVRIRQTLNVESGLNDGIAFPLLVAVIGFGGLSEQAETVSSIARFTILQLTLGPLVGVGVGYVGGKAIARAAGSGWMNDVFQRLSLVGLALLAYAAGALVGGNGFIAAFCAGIAVGNFARGVCPRLYEFGETEGQLLTLLVFMVFGAFALPQACGTLDAPSVLYAILSLTVVRMLPVALSLVGTGLRPRSLLFLGWFGPRGLASIIFGYMVIELHGLAEASAIGHVVALTVVFSIVLHGVTAAPAACRYGAWARRHEGEEEMAEHRKVEEMPVRLPHRLKP